MDILTSGHSQKLWHYGSQEVTYSATSQMVRAFIDHKVENWKSSQRTQNQPERGAKVKEVVPAKMSVGWICSLMMDESDVYIFDQLESTISLWSQLFSVLCSL